MEALWDDVRTTLRALKRDAGFSAIVILTLTLGIGGNAGIFGVAAATFFGRLPFPKSDRILRLLVSLRRPDGSVSTVTIRGREFNVLRQMTTVPSGPFVAMVGLEDVNATLTGIGPPERVTVLHTTEGWNASLGVSPTIGRWFTPDEERLGEGSRVVTIANALWLRRFGGEADILGRTITLDGAKYSIVGVLPRGFRFPYDAEVWMPVTTPSDLSRDYGVFARLKPGIPVEAAAAALSSAATAVRGQFPDTAEGFGFAQIPLAADLQGGEQRAALALVGVAGFFLLLACLNVANLLLARSGARARDEQIRAALGASRWQLVRRRMVESLLLAAGGTLGALLLAACLSGWLDVLVPSNITRQLGILPKTTDWRVLLASVGVGLLAGLVSGLMPALKNAGASADVLIRQSSRVGRSARERFVMDTLVVMQFTIALALLAAAGLMIGNFRGLTQRNLGVDTAHLLSMRVSLAPYRYRDVVARRALVDDILREVKSRPGVVAAGITTINPLGGGTWWAPVVASGHEADYRDASLLVNHRLISPDLQRAMGIPLLLGRLFSELDTPESAPVALVSKQLAHRLWPNSQALGERIRVNRPGSPWLTVVGVVGDVLDSHDPTEPKETWYLPYAQAVLSSSTGDVYLVVRSAGDPRSVQQSAEQAVWRADPGLAIFDQSTMGSYYLQTLSRERLSALTIAALAVFGLLLGAVGIYGIISLSIGERVREIGIRMALGARAPQIRRLVLREGLRLSALGAGLGLISAWGVGRALASQLPEVNPADPLTMLGAALLLMGAAGLAIDVPARRASSMAPREALRQD